MIKSRNVIEITGITELKFRTKNQGGEKYMYKRKSVENQKNSNSSYWNVPNVFYGNNFRWKKCLCCQQTT